jgi:phosphomannomutase
MDASRLISFNEWFMQHRFDPTILREYDIRGIYEDTLHIADARAVGLSFGTTVRRNGGKKIAVGRDGRVSSPQLTTALIEGLNAAGIDVIDIGLVSTPMLYFAVFHFSTDGGMMVTGSHNPADYNGFKMVHAHGPFYGEDIQRLGRMAALGDWESGTGAVTECDIEDAYVARLARDYPGRAFRIGWDAGNGAAGRVIEKLTHLLPGEHHLLFTEIDGRFPNHHPDPTVEENLADLKNLVAEKSLDFGLAFDGDGDRIGAIDGQGRVIWGDQILSILAESVLQQEPGATIIADVKASQALYDRIAELGGQPLMWKTGHSLIKVKMKETDSPLAGEMSGHIFYRHGWYGFDDAQYVAVRFMQAIAEQGRSLSAIRDAMPNMINTPELRFQVDESRKFAVVDEILARLEAEGATVNRTDGARVNTPDGWWLLRASNTQDVLVARAEAQDQAGLDRLMAQIDAQLAASGLERGETVGH